MRVENPVLVMGFNRPKSMKSCLTQLHSIGITDVYLHLDGPRPNNLDDLHQTQAVKKVVDSFQEKFKTFIIENQESNLGCRRGVINALTWFFSKNSKGIIVEDDILISSNFIRFADEALYRYKKTQNIWHINGWSPNNKPVISNSAFSTRYAIPWGWATWAEKWNAVVDVLDKSSQVLPSKMPTNLHQNLPKQFDEYWSRNFNLADNGIVQGWDYQWIRAMWLGGGNALSPPFRMTTNIGFDSYATHTFRPNRNQIPAFTVKGTWNFEECNHTNVSDALIGELTFSHTQKTSVFLSNIKLRHSASSRTIQKNNILRTLEVFSFREFLSQYFSLTGIKCTFLILFRKIKLLRLMNNYRASRGEN